MRSCLVAAALALIALPAAAVEPCKAPPEGDAARLELATPVSEADRLGLSAAMLLALDDDSGRASWPDDAIEAAPPCPLGEFKAGDIPWSLSGGQGNAPPRVIQNPASEAYVFLALGPSLAEARAWLEAGGGDGLRVQRPTYFLVGANHALRFVHRLYDGMPSEADLIADATALLEGRLAPLAVFDAQGQAVSLMVATQSGVQAQLFAPQDQPASLYGPDGKYFAPAGDAATRMRGSGLVCPASLGRLARTRMLLVNGTDARLDLGCGYNGAESWITLFVTRAADPLQPAFEQRIAEARKDGVVRTLSTASQGLERGEVWQDRKGAGQGLWMARRGPYLIEARATFALQDQGAIERAVASIARQAAEVAER